MVRVHRTRLYPTDKQANMLRWYVGGARFAYNWGLETWNTWYDEYKAGVRDKRPNWIRLSKAWTESRPKWAAELPRTVVTTALKNLNSAFVNMFNKNAETPKFKRKGIGSESFRIEVGKFSVKRAKKAIHIPHIKTGVRMAEELRFSGKLTSCTVTYVAGRWYAGIEVETEDTRDAPMSTAGVDVGLTNPAVCSDGTVLSMPNEVLLNLENRRRKADRCVCRRHIGSSRYYKALLRKQRIQERINNIRRDAIHKFTSAVCKNHATVVVENLNAARMHENPNKKIRVMMQQSCMAEVLRQLHYKAIRLVVADRWYPSSQLCHVCGHRQPMPPSVRVFNCPQCGVSTDRDLNAAINLSKYPGSPG